MPAVVYDMDLTITAWPTYTRWLIFWARAHAPWRLLLLPMVGAVGVGYRLGFVSRAVVKEQAQALVMGWKVDRAAVDATAIAFAASVPLYFGALAQIAADRAAGFELVIATASFDYYARAIAARVGIGRVVATASVWEGDTLRPRLAGENCYGAAKATMVRAALADTVIARAYSDHWSDRPLFELAAEAVVVNPAFGLRRRAARAGYRAIDWR